MPVEDVHEAEYTGTPWKLIVRRIKYSGYSSEEALFEDYNEQDTETKERKRLSQLEHEDRMRLVRLERQKELDLRRKKPHLFEVPQNILAVNGVLTLWRTTYSLERWLDHEY